MYNNFKCSPKCCLFYACKKYSPTQKGLLLDGFKQESFLTSTGFWGCCSWVFSCFVFIFPEHIILNIDCLPKGVFIVIAPQILSLVEVTVSMEQVVVATNLHKCATASER